MQRPLALVWLAAAWGVLVLVLAHWWAGPGHEAAGCRALRSSQASAVLLVGGTGWRVGVLGLVLTHWVTGWVLTQVATGLRYTQGLVSAL